MIAQALRITRRAADPPLTQCGTYCLIAQKAPEAVCSSSAANRLKGLCGFLKCADANAQAVPGVVSDTLKRLDLTAVGVQVESVDRLDQFTDSNIVDMINRGWPVAVMITPHGSTSDINHYVLITGYDLDAQKYEVWDPDPTDGGWRTVTRRGLDELGTWVGAVAIR